MTIEQLIQAIERRGYSVAILPPDPDEVSPRGYDILLISRRDVNEMTSTDWAILHRELEQLDVSLWFHALNERLMHLSDMHHHVRCLQCDFPLLRHVNVARAVSLAQHAATSKYAYCDKYLEPILDPAIEQAMRPGYRAVANGPKSNPLMLCPRCYNKLDETSVGEFDDFTDLVHQDAMERGELTLNEVRMIQGLPPLPPGGGLP